LVESKNTGHESHDRGLSGYGISEIWRVLLAVKVDRNGWTAIRLSA
jgi:glucokinase